MKKFVTLPLVVVVALLQFGCGTSCGRKEDPLLWADGVTREVDGVRIYESTPMEGTWLHFPSYRRFRFVHGFGTKDVTIDTYVSLAEDEPAKTGSKIATASSGEVLATFQDENTAIIENSTCENDYFVFARITDRPSSPADAGQ